MKSLKKSLLVSAIIILSSCSNDETEERQESVKNESAKPSINVYDVDFRGIKLKMSEAEAIAKLNEVCLSDGKPSWEKEELTDGSGISQGTLLKCSGSTNEEGTLYVQLNSEIVNSVAWYRKVLDTESSPSLENIQILANKAIDKYGEPSLEVISEEYLPNTLEIESGDDKYRKFEGAKMILCWSDCKKSGRTVSILPSNDSEVGFALAMTPATLRGAILNDLYSKYYESGVLIEQVMIDYPEQIKAYKAYLEKKEVKEKAEEEAEQASSQQAAGKVKF